MQLQAADELLVLIFFCVNIDVNKRVIYSHRYARDWRYHTELFVWITNSPEMNVLETSTEWKEGTYYVFDTEKWLKVRKQLKIDCSKLEKRC